MFLVKRKIKNCCKAWWAMYSEGNAISNPWCCITINELNRDFPLINCVLLRSTLLLSDSFPGGNGSHNSYFRKGDRTVSFTHTRNWKSYKDLRWDNHIWRDKKRSMGGRSRIRLPQNISCRVQWHSDSRYVYALTFPTCPKTNAVWQMVHGFYDHTSSKTPANMVDA